MSNAGLSAYNLELTREAEKSLAFVWRADRRLYERFAAAFDDLCLDPWLGKPLQNTLKGFYSYRLGSYRILYEIHQRQLRIIVIDLGHRKAIYGDH
jgi:mRNA interferase RelE/StbE